MAIGEYSIEAKKRDLKTGPRSIRRAGDLPAVVYGKETESIPVQINAKTFHQLYRQAGESSLVTLQLAGEDDRLVLFREPQYNPRTNEMIHIDLYQIKLGEKLKADIPLVFEGEAPAVKDLDGVLITNKDEVEVECLPRDLPKEIKVDLSSLTQIDDSILVKDLKLPEGVEVLDEPDESIVVVAHQREEEEPTVTEEEAVADVEVESKEGEKDGDEAEGKSSEDASAEKGSS